jgi:hypothetical protein
VTVSTQDGHDIGKRSNPVVPYDGAKKHVCFYTDQNSCNNKILDFATSGYTVQFCQ